MAEWFKALVLKTSDGQPSVSSNLTASARRMVARGSAARDYTLVREITCFAADHNAQGDWLMARRVDAVAMEPTALHWIPLF